LHGHGAAAIGVEREPEYAAPRPGEVRRSVLANARARALLGWEPRNPLERGIGATLERMRGIAQPGPRASQRSIFTRRSAPHRTRLRLAGPDPSPNIQDSAS